MVSSENRRKLLLRHCLFFSFFALKIRALAFRGANRNEIWKEESIQHFQDNGPLAALQGGTSPALPSPRSAESIPCRRGPWWASCPPGLLGFAQRTRGPRRGAWHSWTLSLLQVKQTQGVPVQFSESKPCLARAVFGIKPLRGK